MAKTNRENKEKIISMRNLSDRVFLSMTTITSRRSLTMLTKITTMPLRNG